MKWIVSVCLPINQMHKTPLRPKLFTWWTPSDPLRSEASAQWFGLHCEGASTCDGTESLWPTAQRFSPWRAGWTDHRSSGERNLQPRLREQEGHHRFIIKEISSLFIYLLFIDGTFFWGKWNGNHSKQRFLSLKREHFSIRRIYCLSKQSIHLIFLGCQDLWSIFSDSTQMHRPIWLDVRQPVTKSNII